MEHINQLFRVIGHDEHAIAMQDSLAAAAACGIMLMAYLVFLAVSIRRAPPCPEVGDRS